MQYSRKCDCQGNQKTAQNLPKCRDSSRTETLPAFAMIRPDSWHSSTSHWQARAGYCSDNVLNSSLRGGRVGSRNSYNPSQWCFFSEGYWDITLKEATVTSLQNPTILLRRLTLNTRNNCSRKHVNWFQNQHTYVGWLDWHLTTQNRIFFFLFAPIWELAFIFGA
jgi:hypothetical protein